MTLRQRLAGLTACLVIIGIVAGLPFVLMTVGGSPFPKQLATFRGLLDALTTPDDGTLALAVLGYVGWIVWLFLAISIVVEIAAQLRRVRIPHLPGLQLPQLAVRHLVATAAALFVTAPFVLGYAAPSIAAPPSTTTSQTSDKPVPDRHHRSSAPQDHGHGTIERTVRPGDTLSGLADRYLEDPSRWPQIFEESRDIRQPDGRQMSDPDLIVDGWTVRLPAGADPHGDPRDSGEREVRPGDTLSGLAETELGDADRWPEIFDASTAIRQPDGERLTDPDVIRPGWTLRLADEAAHPEPTEHQAKKPDQPQSGTGPSNQPRAGQPSTPPAPTPTAAPPTASSTSTVDTRTTGAVPAEPTLTAPTHSLEMPWMLTGFAMGGAVLAGSAFLVLRRRRKHQMRTRRPGKNIPRPAPEIRPVEKTITAIGSVSANTVRAMDELLRDLAATRTSAGTTVPALSAVELSDDHITLHLTDPAELDLPWISNGDACVWSVPYDTDASALAVNQPAPYPLLVTIGTSDDDHLWLLNLEGTGVVNVTSDPTYGADLLRYIAAELAVNPWSRDVTVGCLGVATEVAPIDAYRVRVYDTAGEAAAAYRLEAEETLSRAESVGHSAVTARSAQLADEAWPAQVLMIDGAHAQDPEVQALIALIAENPQRTATSIVINSSVTDSSRADEGKRASSIVIDDHGRLDVDGLDLPLAGVGLTPDEAEGCALLLAHADIVEDADSSPEAVEAVIDDGPAEAVPMVSATTEIAPQEDVDVSVTSSPGTVSAAVDPDLDADLAAWFAESCDRPRLALLGPVRVRANGVPIAKRKPYYTEFLAYLALRSHGARPDELAEAFGLSPATVRTAIKTVRDWLGDNPRTGDRHLPEATRSRAARERGIAVYQVDDLLTDVELFERLRKRGIRMGPDGVDDLCNALGLVTGRPFDQLRPGGWSWLIDLGVDNAMQCAIVDVAHSLVEHFLQTDEPERARAAAETALFAAPTDAIPKLDLAKVARHGGHHEEAKRLALEVVRDSETDGVPDDLDQRTAQLVSELMAPTRLRRPDQVAS